jgi:hypothetical protein
VRVPTVGIEVAILLSRSDITLTYYSREQPWITLSI